MNHSLSKEKERERSEDETGGNDARARRALRVKSINIIKIVSITNWAGDEKKTVGRMQKRKTMKTARNEKWVKPQS